MLLMAVQQHQAFPAILHPPLHVIAPTSFLIATAFDESMCSHGSEFTDVENKPFDSSTNRLILGHAAAVVRKS